MENTLDKMIKIITDRKVDILTIKDVREMSTFADTFVVAIADNERQIQGVMNEFRSLKDPNTFIEGSAGDSWIIILTDDVCVHLFTYEEHEKYRLDTLYKDQPTIEL